MLHYIKFLFSLFIILLPWKLKRLFLVHFYKYDLDPTSHIGFSYIYPKILKMGPGSRIDHKVIAIHLDSISLGQNSSIGRGCWITGFPTGSNYDIHRKSELIIGNESAITKNHHIDCTNAIHVGNYVTIAGYNSQLLTHSIDYHENRQDSHPIVINDYCFVSTGVIILGGSSMPAHSVLAAGAVLNKVFSKEWVLYGGVPAKPIKDIPLNAKYFTREIGFVY